jgi:hypothetical protein
VEKILVEQPAFHAHLGPKVRVTKRTGEVVKFHVRTVVVADAIIARNLSPERAHVRIVLRVASEIFGITRTLPITRSPIVS